MAISVSTLVWNLTPTSVTPMERLVLLCLADHCRHDGHNAWPAVPTITRRTSLDRRSVQRLLRRLTTKGFIHPEGRMARAGAIRYGLDLAHLQEHAHRGGTVPPPSSGTVPRGGGTVSQGGGTVSQISGTVPPDPDLIRQDPSENRAAARRVHAARSRQRQEDEDRRQITATIAFDRLSPEAQAELEHQAAEELQPFLRRAPQEVHAEMIRHCVLGHLTHPHGDRRRQVG